MAELSEFLSALAVDPTKLGEFIHDPESAMQSAGLSDADKVALRSGFASIIYARLAGLSIKEAFQIPLRAQGYPPGQWAPGMLGYPPPVGPGMLGYPPPVGPGMLGYPPPVGPGMVGYSPPPVGPGMVGYSPQPPVIAPSMFWPPPGIFFGLFWLLPVR